MERRLLRKAGYLAGGLVVIAGAVVVLRQAGDKVQAGPPPPPPVQTTVKQFADEGVLLPTPGDRPVPPVRLGTLPGPHRLRVDWVDPGKAAGFEVRLRGKGGVERTVLLTGTGTQFDGLEDDTEYQVEVRTVDAFGQRSDPAGITGRPVSQWPDESRYALVDHFDGTTVPDPVRWRLANNAACAQLVRGSDDDRHRMVITAACGSESVALRSRTPLRLDGGAGRVMIETDAPGQGGELLVDLVPGPVNLIEGSSRGGLPPGTIRVRISSFAVAINDGQPFVRRPPVHDGMSSRWEVAVQPDGVHVLCNGEEIAAAPGAPTWTEATPLFGFTGPPNGLNYVGIDAIGISRGDTPPFVAPPRVITTGGDQAPPAERLAGVLGGQLRVTIRPNYGTATQGPFVVEVNGHAYPARPAVSGQPFMLGVRYPLVADLPAEALVLSGERHELKVLVRNEDPNQPWTAAVQHADIELIPDPAAKPSPDQAAPPAASTPRARPVLAVPSGTLLDAAGAGIENGKPTPGSRVILEVTLAGPGELAGLAGVEIRVDGKRIAGLPTAKDGPGVAGRWRLALNTGTLAPGVRNLEIKAISADGFAAPQIAYVSLQIPS